MFALFAVLMELLENNNNDFSNLFHFLTMPITLKIRNLF